MKKIFVRYRIEIALCMFVLGILSLYYFVGGMFASNVDWFMQHCVFPDEFRKLFYIKRLTNYENSGIISA